jgi:type I restriction enzyme S subunit
LSEDDLPAGWCRVTVRDVADVQLGKMLDAAKHTRGRRFQYLRNANVRWGAFDLSDLNEMFFEADELEHFSLKKGDLLVCEGGEPGRAAVWPGPDSEIKFQKALLRIRTGPRALPAWLMYALRLDALSGQLEDYFTGSTIKHFPRQSVLKYEFPLPPIAEQKRILAKVEELLSTANTLRERLAHAPAILKRFRRSLLAAACEGRLTQPWRTAVESPGMNADSAGLPPGWQRSDLGRFIESMANGIYKPAEYYAANGTPCLRMYNIQNGSLVFNNVKRMRLTARETRFYELLPGDILVNRVNSRELVGKAGIVEQLEERTVFESKNIRLRLDQRLINPRFVNLFLMSEAARVMLADSSKQTVGMATVGQPQLRGLPLAVPPLAEQNEIVRRVEALFKLADGAEKRVAVATARADKLTRAILARAFRGELAPTATDQARL